MLSYYFKFAPKQVILLSCLYISLSEEKNEIDFWNVERPKDMANLASLEVMCGKTHMEVQISFDRPFNGIIFSKGAVDQYDCIYIKPQTGSIAYTFNILYDQCGTKPDMNGKFYENNIVIQYDKDLIEVWDEAKRLRCEWYNDYEKGITKAPIRVSDLEIVELNFRGDNVDCWMEIQHGKGPWASIVSGIVPLGTTLTMVIGINDKQGEFDMRVKSCTAESENAPLIQLSDEHGCVLRPKMISKFMKIAGGDARASVVTYAFFHAFKFPDSMSVHIKCKVEICRFGCPDHCQKPGKYLNREQDVSASLSLQHNAAGPRFEAQRSLEKRFERRNGFEESYNLNLTQSKKNNSKILSLLKNTPTNFQERRKDLSANKLTKVFPRRSKESQNKEQLEQSDKMKESIVYPAIRGQKNVEYEQHGIPNNKKSRKTRGTEELGVVSEYYVISEVDLAFKPDFGQDKGVAVYQGQLMSEEVIFDVCLPTTGFSALFVVLSLITILSVLVCGFFCYIQQINRNEAKYTPSSFFQSNCSNGLVIKLH